MNSVQIVISTSVEALSKSSAAKLLGINQTSSLKERFKVVSLVNMVRLNHPRLISLMVLTQMYRFLSGEERLMSLKLVMVVIMQLNG